MKWLGKDSYYECSCGGQLDRPNMWADHSGIGISTEGDFIVKSSFDDLHCTECGKKYELYKKLVDVEKRAKLKEEKHG